jgi:uncharacterized protein YdeI (YjbR/CyaY-like superfamily)
MPDYERFHPLTRQEWRDWLAANHATSAGIWLVSYKSTTGKPRLSYEDIIEEALCFGWVDSRAKTLDDERSMLTLTPRKPKSVWSKPNKERVERLIAQRRMTPAGLVAVETAKANGSWSALDAIDQLQMPEDLTEALTANPTALRHFDAFPASSKKQILWWIEGAKRPQTRQKRIADTIRLAEQNVRPQ